MILFDQAGAGELGSTLMPPNSGLKDFVEHFWIQCTPATTACTPWRIVPDASPHIIVSVARGSRCLENARCLVVGARSRFVDVSLSNRALTLGVRLLPGALPLLTRLPASDFTDCSRSLEDSFGTQGKALTNQLADQRSTTQALNLLSDFLSQALRNERPYYYEIGSLASHVDSVENLAAMLGVPHRTLYVRMKEQVGLSPKRLLRVQRLHRALAIRRTQPTPWSHVSAICGLADQAHLVREFQELLGEAPGAWEQRAFAGDFYKTSPTAPRPGASPNR